MAEPQKRSRALHKAVPPSFGEDVRRVRLARGLTLKNLGRGAGYSEGHVSKVETGLVAPSMPFAEGCDHVFGTGDLFARQLKRILEGEFPSWFGPYIDAEREATSIRDFSTVFVMGLLQTEDYARAVLQGGWETPDNDDLEAMVASRMRRRGILERPEPPRVLVVLHEACLWARVGSHKLMAAQLAHMLSVVRQHRTLTIQVLPYSCAEYGLSAPFTLLEIPDEGPVVYVEGPQGGRPYDAASTIRNATGYFDHLRACSLSPQDSLAYIESVRSEHARNTLGQVQLQRFPGRPVRRVGPGTRVRRKGPG